MRKNDPPVFESPSTALLRAVLLKYPALIFPPPPKARARITRRKNKVIDNRTLKEWEIAQSRFQSYPSYLTQILNAPSIFAYISAYRETLDDPKFGSGTVIGNRVLSHRGFDFQLGQPKWDFSKGFISQPSLVEIADDINHLLIYLQQRAVIQLMNICLAIGKVHDGKTEFSHLNLTEIAQLRKTSGQRGKGGGKGTVNSSLSAFRLFTDNKLLRGLLSQWEFFFPALRFEPCLLQTDLGVRNIKAYPLWVSDGPEFLSQSFTPPKGAQHAGVTRSLLLMKAHAPELFDGRDINKEILALLESEKVVSDDALTIGNFRKIAFRTLLGEPYSKN